MLGYDEWLEGLERGVAAHHAGLVPVFRETVEECFAAGLLKVVFATETLSLGINMPARTVVIERFTKYGSAGRATLTSGEYLQLTGRAGRRGLDEEGHAVVAWSSEITFAEAARVALGPAARPPFRLPAHVQPGRQPGRALRRGDRRRGAAAVVRPVAGAQARPRLLRQLGHRVAVLEHMGYLDGWSLTAAGRRLSRIYHEADLLIAEALGSDVLEGRSRPCWRACSRRWSSSRVGPDVSPAITGTRPPPREAPRSPAGPPGRHAHGRARPALRGRAGHGGAHPGDRGGPPGAAHQTARPGPGHRSRLVGTRGLVRDRPRRGGP